MCIDCGLMLIGFLMIPVFDKEHKQFILFRFSYTFY